MEAYILQGTEDTPEVNLDPANSKFMFAGNSLPENAVSFYEPILAWIEDYGASPNSETTVEVKMNYFNTSSSKLLLDVLFAFAELSENGHQVKVQWYYQEEDEDMEEAGTQYEEIVEVPFEHFSYEEY